MSSVVLIDVTKFPMFRGYVFMFSIRYFWFSYCMHLKSGFKNLQYGNILFVLLLPFKAFVDVWKLTDFHIINNLKQPLEMYKILQESDR